MRQNYPTNQENPHWGNNDGSYRPVNPEWMAGQNTGYPRDINVNYNQQYPSSVNFQNNIQQPPLVQVKNMPTKFDEKLLHVMKYSGIGVLALSVIGLVWGLF